MIRLKHLLTETKNISTFSTSANDEYEYKKENNIWYTKLKTSDDWLDMKTNLSTSNYNNAIKILSNYINEPVKKDVVKSKSIEKSIDVTPKKQKELPTTPIIEPIEPANSESDSNSTVILMGGLDYRAGDYKIDQQKAILQSGLSGQTVIAHRYTNLANVLKSIEENPDAVVVLFSAGASYSSTISKAMKDKTKLYIVEPYAKSANTTKSVRSAVKRGVPLTNVLTGNTRGRGAGIVDGSTQTPNVKGGGMASHWNALKFVGKLI